MRHPSSHVEPPAARQDARPPRVAGRFVVARPIGKGSRAAVYLAWDARLKLWLALKVPTSAEPEEVERFEADARTLARLSHPSLLRVLDLGWDGAVPYAVTELARGGTLASWIQRNGPMAPAVAVQVVLQCADGLRHAHEAGLVHRDVSPQHVLIREDGRVVLGAFGLPRAIDAEATTAGAALGTLAYAAPEQRTDPWSVDARADVYALGATLCALLTGRTSPDLFLAEVRPELLAGVPEALRPVLRAACRFERAWRYRTMADLGEALERCAEELPPARGAPPLADALLPLPKASPPVRLEPGVDLADLRARLGGTDEGELTQVAGTRRPRPEPTRWERPLAPAPALPPELHTTSTFPPVVRAPPPERAWTPWLVAGGVGCAVALAASLGVMDKWRTSRDLHAADATLVAAVRPEVVSSLPGEDAGVRELRQRWFDFADAAGPTARVEAAEAFGRLAVELHAGDGAATEVRVALDAHDAALAELQRARTSWFGWLTGDLGTW